MPPPNEGIIKFCSLYQCHISTHLMSEQRPSAIKHEGTQRKSSAA